MILIHTEIQRELKKCYRPPIDADPAQIEIFEKRYVQMHTPHDRFNLLCVHCTQFMPF